jgi:hypothetical protein
MTGADVLNILDLLAAVGVRAWAPVGVRWPIPRSGFASNPDTPSTGGRPGASGPGGQRPIAVGRRRAPEVGRGTGYTTPDYATPPVCDSDMGSLSNSPHIGWRLAPLWQVAAGIWWRKMVAGRDL